MPNQDATEDVKKLLILLLMKLGATSEELAMALQVDSSVVRKMISGRKVKRIVGAAEV